MESLPPGSWSELATKHNINELRAATKKDVELGENRIGRRFERVEERIDRVEERMGQRIDIFAATIRGEMSNLHRELTLTMVTTFHAQTRNLMIAPLGTMIAFTGVVFSALELI